MALTVSITSRYKSNPDEEHWIAVKHIFEYFWMTKNLFLIFGGASELRIEGYIDSDFMSDFDDRKSTSGYVFICNGGVVSWKYFKQSIITDSTTEVEYVATLDAIKEDFWFKEFVVELDTMILDAIPLYCDNNGAIVLTKELQSHQKLKHIEWRFHIIRNYFEK